MYTAVILQDSVFFFTLEKFSPAFIYHLQILLLFLVFFTFMFLVFFVWIFIKLVQFSNLPLARNPAAYEQDLFVSDSKKMSNKHKNVSWRKNGRMLLCKVEAW